MKLKELVTNAREFADKNSPSLLTGIGIAGLIGTAIMVYKASPKIHYILDGYKAANDLAKTKEEKRENTKQMLKELAPVVLPPAGLMIATGAAIIGANNVSSRRIAMLSAAYSMSNEALKTLQVKTEEIFDPKRVQQVKDAVAQKKLDDRNVNTAVDNIILTRDGDVLCLDCYSGRLFRSSAQKIGQSINELSADVQSDMYVSLNDLYDKIGLDRIPMGEDFGWNVDDLNRGQLMISLSSALTKDNQPCLVIDYDVSPRMDYRRLH